jgi:hypothetical protein
MIGRTEVVDVDKSCWEEAHGRKREMGMVVRLLLDQGSCIELIFCCTLQCCKCIDQCTLMSGLEVCNESQGFTNWHRSMNIQNSRL